jgi:tRNA threonylcarbamoyl adenosine modification protein (Sua5/YciO/YrdC/YwlC family)
MRDALNIIKKGGVIIYPSESSYGIGCDATNSKAVRRIFKIKRRRAKGLLIFVSDKKMAGRYAEVNSIAARLMKKFMPGPLSLVSEKKMLPDCVSRKTIGFRISSNAFARNLVKKFGKPIVSTSANISGKSQLYKISDVISNFYGKVDMIVDYGDLPEKPLSTIFDCTTNQIIRKGAINGEKILKAIKS